MFVLNRELFWELSQLARTHRLQFEHSIIWKLGTIASVILSVAGFLAITYSVPFIGGFGIHHYPYQDLGIALLLIGICTFALAAVLSKKFMTQEKIDTYLR